jgi:TRAP-type mannitol/chloroaromatic compound transport system substrate-binding protein
VELGLTVAGNTRAGRNDRECTHPKDGAAVALKAAKELYDEKTAADPMFRRFCQSWTLFRYTQYQWYRVAAASFNNFMAGRRLPSR